MTNNEEIQNLISTCSESSESIFDIATILADPTPINAEQREKLALLMKTVALWHADVLKVLYLLSR